MTALPWGQSAHEEGRCAMHRPCSQNQKRLEAFDDRDVGKTTAFAHGLKAITLVLRLERMNQSRHELGAGGAERMTKRNRAAMHVETGLVRTEMLRPGDRHRGEGFVDFIKIDIVDLHASLLQRLLRTWNGRFQHDDRVATNNRHVMDAGKRLDAKRL